VGAGFGVNLCLANKGCSRAFQTRASDSLVETKQCALMKLHQDEGRRRRSIISPCGNNRNNASLQQRNETTHYLPSLSYFSFFSQKRKVAKEKGDFLPKAPPAKK
jgi:hypothetical protein